MPKSLPKTERTTAKIDDLNPAPYNPRRITERAFNGLKASIENFGLVQEIVVNRRNMTVVGGHQRLQAMRAHGFTEVPVCFVDLDDNQERALNVSLNSQLIAGEWTDELDELLYGIKEWDGELFVDLRLNELADLEQGEIEVPEEPPEATKFEVVVECMNKGDQEDLIDRLKKEGYKATTR